jgi:tRNA threonylcarbamoyladenosine biosynthesis protein TsaE
MLTHSLAETNQLAAAFAAQLQGGEFVVLEGDLGAGKTAFVRGVCAALGVKDRVRSPTFTIMNQYLASRSAIKHLIHLDFYRLLEGGGLEDLGLEEWLGRRDAVILAEWPHPALALPPSIKLRRVRIEILSAADRQIEIE